MLTINLLSAERNRPERKQILDSKNAVNELFYTSDIEGQRLRLDEQESIHCLRVLRHTVGDEIDVIDGRGGLIHCRITDTAGKKVSAEALSKVEHWGARPYRLSLAVCPTKNIDRYEWMVEKATELGVDEIVPLIGERSERKVVKTERLERVVLSAAKQSLKAYLPEVRQALTVKDFFTQQTEIEGRSLKLIAYCSEEGERLSIMKALRDRLPLTDEMRERTGYAAGQIEDAINGSSSETKIETADHITILIGPEGDFSPKEVEAAFAAGFIPVHLGSSRLRTETAGLTAAEAVYLHYMG